MKRTHFRLLITTLGFLCTGMVSCDLNKIQYTEDDSENVQSEVVSAAYFEDAADLSSTVVSSPTETNGGGRTIVITDVRFACANITLDVDPTSTRAVPSGLITIDFGSGCADKRGNTRSGKVLIAYMGKRFLPNSTISTTFDNYTINGVLMSGTYLQTNTATSSAERPAFSISVSGGSLAFPNGKSVTRDSEVTREWIRTTNGASDQWIVTGQASGTNRNGMVYALSVTDSLKFYKICQVSNAKFLPSKGKEVLIVGNKRIDIDFGNGSCDQEVTIEIKGKSTTADVKSAL